MDELSLGCDVSLPQILSSTTNCTHDPSQALWRVCMHAKLIREICVRRLYSVAVVAAAALAPKRAWHTAAAESLPLFNGRGPHPRTLSTKAPARTELAKVFFSRPAEISRSTRTPSSSPSFFLLTTRYFAEDFLPSERICDNVSADTVKESTSIETRRECVCLVQDKDEEDGGHDRIAPTTSALVNVVDDVIIPSSSSSSSKT